ncbi:hypothetical protein KSZ_52090 [Dictyobacter formicarum]|uniref:Transposase InsH N-terminal domain-containing protein n=1 Tax=Dictyobacter formicarum TaxID=2778368 RepID=A0ABQ3VNN7_9CHLR|nr:hypothetical protein KSZ_52090 [Dictyobacter formicarum]
MTVVCIQIIHLPIKPMSPPLMERVDSAYRYRFFRGCAPGMLANPPVKGLAAPCIPALLARIQKTYTCKR